MILVLRGKKLGRYKHGCNKIIVLVGSPRINPKKVEALLIEELDEVTCL